jgi:uncharacterized membrane protein YqgA involved in biofilm formation
MSDVVQTSCGLITMVLGFQMAFGYQNVVFLTLALILGALAGEWLDLDGRILSLGKGLEKIVLRGKPAAGDTNRFALAFLNSSVLFCTGAMAIVGSIQAGVRGDYTVIMTKSVMDGFLAIGFAAAMGPGVAFSALSILVYQGAITLLAKNLSVLAREAMLAELGAVGGVMIVMIGLGLTGIKSIKTANYLPALVFAALFVAVQGLFKG